MLLAFAISAFFILACYAGALHSQASEAKGALNASREEVEKLTHDFLVREKVLPGETREEVKPTAAMQTFELLQEKLKKPPRVALSVFKEGVEDPFDNPMAKCVRCKHHGVSEDKFSICLRAPWGGSSYLHCKSVLGRLTDPSKCPKFEQEKG